MGKMRMADVHPERSDSLRHALNHSAKTLKKTNRPLGGRGRFHSALAPGGKCFEQFFGFMPNRGRGRHSLGLVRAVPVAFLSCQFGEEFLLADQT